MRLCSSITIAGGTLILSAGAQADGSISFTGSGGVFQIDDTTMPSAEISGFAPGDEIDLQAISFDDPVDHDTSISFDSATGALTVSDNGTSNTLTLSNVASGSIITISPDDDAGTAITFLQGEIPNGDVAITGTGGPQVFDFSSVQYGNAMIGGFDPTQATIKLNNGVAADFTAVQSDMSSINVGTLITLDASRSIMLPGVAPASLSAGNFQFV